MDTVRKPTLKEAIVRVRKAAYALDDTVNDFVKGKGVPSDTVCGVTPPFTNVFDSLVDDLESTAKLLEELRLRINDSIVDRVGYWDTGGAIGAIKEPVGISGSRQR